MSCENNNASRHTQRRGRRALPSSTELEVFLENVELPDKTLSGREVGRLTPGGDCSGLKGIGVKREM